MMDISTINWLAILVGAVSSFALGSVWYAKPVFAGAAEGIGWVATGIGVIYLYI